MAVKSASVKTQDLTRVQVRIWYSQLAHRLIFQFPAHVLFCRKVNIMAFLAVGYAGENFADPERHSQTRIPVNELVSYERLCQGRTIDVCGFADLRKALGALNGNQVNRLKVGGGGGHVFGPPRQSGAGQHPGSRLCRREFR